MNDLITNLLRGSVSSVMYVILLFTLTKSRFGRKGPIIVAVSVFILNLSTTIWFYLYGDLTSLSRFSILLFIVVGLLLKPLTRLSLMQWSFTFLTTINIGMMIIILSFHLGKLFPWPQYAHTAIRFILYLAVIIIFKKYFLRSYRSVVNNWPVFSGLMICIFLNLSYYFYVTDDIQNTLMTFKWPLLLLVTLSIAAYGTVFYSLKKFAAMYTLEVENIKFQHETGILQQAALKLEQYANYDTLTTLPNRRFFFEQLERTISKSEKDGKKVAILFIDLDAFKDINDNHGHEIGDEVLIVVGNLISQCIRKSDFVARLGGDEFAVIMEDIDDTTSAIHLAERIHIVLKEPMQIKSITCTIDSSIGIAIYPDTGTDSESLLRNADSAMYKIKRNGKGAVDIFTRD